ncbi:Lactoperoxidase [Portunus trituberculatus]|uniref:Lactoperoxidase n=1 Tax=Portunus trituberculatus TaxID=210409 RepID=A0A5B7I8Y4_PORTR|nr:Lactoperoxidase [Portunus trituberculatus]
MLSTCNLPPPPLLILLFLLRDVPVSCNVSYRYRTITGRCNNLLNPHLGTSGQPMSRVLPPVFGPRAGVDRVQTRPHLDKTGQCNNFTFSGLGKVTLGCEAVRGWEAVLECSL